MELTGLMSVFFFRESSSHHWIHLCIQLWYKFYYNFPTAAWLFRNRQSHLETCLLLSRTNICCKNKNQELALCKCYFTHRYMCLTGSLFAWLSLFHIFVNWPQILHEFEIKWFLKYLPYMFSLIFLLIALKRLNLFQKIGLIALVKFIFL